MGVEAVRDAALAPLPPGPLLRIASGALVVDIAPRAGGRIAQVTHAGVPWLQGFDNAHAAAIAWGSYPMAPWAGRLRHGAFRFEGRDHRVAINLGRHAIHGVAFALPWHVDAHSVRAIELSLALPQDEHWPFGGCVRQRIAVGERRLEQTLSITAGALAMPVALGWHPWLRKPERLEFTPRQAYPRDAEGIATLPLAAPPLRPWDDCFVHRGPIQVERAGQRLTLSSDCTRWVVYDEPAHATCIEPQTGPPDAFNLEPFVLAPGATHSAWLRWEWR